MKNILDTVLHGYFNKREYLAEYLTVKAGESKYKPETFLFECLKAIEGLEDNLGEQLQERKRELDRMHQINPQGGYMKEFKRLSLADFFVPLFPVAGGKFYGQLSYSNIQEIKQAIDEAKKSIKDKAEQETGGKAVTGFDCSLSPEKVKEIYYLMAGKQIRGDLSDFQAIFSNSSNTVKNPIQWLVLNERGNNSGRGNQTALNEFLKMMLGKLSNNDREKAKNLFIDEQGYFIKRSLLKPDKKKIKTYGFETKIKQILKKADH